MERHHDARRDDLRFRGPSSDRLSLLADAHPDPASCTDSPNLLAFSNEMRSPGANPGTESIDSTLMSELALPSSAREASPLDPLRSRSHSMSAATPTLSDAGGKKATSSPRTARPRSSRRVLRAVPVPRRQGPQALPAGLTTASVQRLAAVLQCCRRQRRCRHPLFADTSNRDDLLRPRP